ncbi:MAG: ribosome-associated translation inhibitor RaiA [Acidobacteria bacterium]|nr:ribosome-associated translation inhibitor RaiA [Acidobacteriota bacterium]MBU2438429.1 ribosome-associated translation inhibitor RaiA [Acidobacteriota bacterium]MBU4253076.1 ribosome-associated translation inhibitor RaiA [Acidobacteriota bacterium]MBU4494219.1 ribosome-associated translation inhibitor RaiA [Acidobacteriota bacterium]
MNINFTARQTHITPEIKKYCERRIKSIEIKLGTEVEADIILSTEKYRNIAEVNIKSRVAQLNAEEETSDMMSSLDAAFDQLDRRTRKEKEKLRKRKRRKQKESGLVPPAEEETRKKVIRSQDYSLKPMSVEEALIQLDSGKKEVFVFRHIGSEKWAVVYKRRDGHFGFIEPE